MSKGAIFLRRAGQVGIGIGIAVLIWAAIAADGYYATWGVIIILGGIGGIRYSTHVQEQDEERQLKEQYRDEAMKRAKEESPELTHMEWINKEYAKLRDTPKGK